MKVSATVKTILEMSAKEAKQSTQVIFNSQVKVTQSYLTRASLSMEFSRQEYWSGLPCPPPGDLPNPGIKPRSPTLQADSLPSESPGRP